jgi:hypothetical protein
MNLSMPFARRAWANPGSASDPHLVDTRTGPQSVTSMAVFMIHNLVDERLVARLACRAAPITITVHVATRWHKEQ